MTIELGMKYRDRISGFTGTATGYVRYITGCNQVLLGPKAKDDGTLSPSEWFDEQRLVQVEGERIVLDNGSTPGFDRPAPKR